MLTPENSRMLAKKRQIAVYNKDFKMVKKIEEIKHNKEIDDEIKNYKVKKEE